MSNGVYDGTFTEMGELGGGGIGGEESQEFPFGHSKF